MDREAFPDASVHAFLSKWRTASLATVDAHNQPHAANVQYVHDEHWNLYFVSNPASAHSLHVEHQPQVALTVYAHTHAPNRIHGLQIHGICRRITDESESRHAWKLYSSKFVFVKLPGVRKIVKRESFYVVTPTWMRWIDNRRGFGFKVEKRLAANKRE